MNGRHDRIEQSRAQSGNGRRPAAAATLTAAMAPRIGLGRRARLARAAFTIIAAGAAIASIIVSPDARGLAGAALALLMCAIALYDARHFVIPNALSAAAFALALAHAAALDPHAPLPQVGIALARACACGGMFLAIRLGYRRWRGRDGLGLGDVKLAAVAGAWLDWFALAAALEIAVVAALGSYLVRHYLGRRPLRATDALPLGLYLRTGDLGCLVPAGDAACAVSAARCAASTGARRPCAARAPRPIAAPAPVPSRSRRGSSWSRSHRAGARSSRASRAAHARPRC